jgi:ribonuclease R
MPRKKSGSNKKDPYHIREKTHYANPIPSREFIITLLLESKKPKSLNQIIEALDIEEQESKRAVEKRLQAMLRDDQLQQDKHKKYRVMPNSTRVSGRVHISRNQVATVVPEDSSYQSQYIVINHKQARTVMHNDQVVVRFTPNDHNKRTIGVLVEHLERAQTQIVGRLRHLNQLWAIETMTPLVTGHIVCDVSNKEFKPGVFVKAKITDYPTAHQSCHALITEQIGKLDSPTLVRDMMVNTYDLPGAFSAQEQQEAKAIDQTGIQIEPYRLDWRDRHFITIDGEDARDFDDAILVEKINETEYVLTVAISDVSHYIQADSILDKAAYTRSTSVYLPNTVLPMIPSVLSDGLCSLCPNVDRLVKAIEIKLTGSGDVIDYTIHHAVICSKARLSYKSAHRIIHGDERAPQWLTSCLEHAHNLYQQLDKQRKQRGALEIELPFSHLIFDDQNKIKTIQQGTRLDTHKIIEEFMLIANEHVAEYLLKHKASALFRNHNKPDQLKLQMLGQFLSHAGIEVGLTSDKVLATKQLQKVIGACMATHQGNIYVPLILSALAQACYEPDNKGHYGLAYKNYCHFTSPIRRYPDLIVHRALDHLLHEQLDNKSLLPRGVTITSAGKHCSSMERIADEAQKKATQWLKCHFMLDKVGQTFDATITSIRSFGLFACIEPYGVDGLIHISTLNSYFRFDESRLMLTDDQCRRSYAIGQKIKVRLQDVDVLEQNIDLEIV